MDYSKFKKIRTLHPSNLKVENQFIPLPVEIEPGCEVNVKKNIERQTAKGVLNIIWIKYKAKVSKTIWLVNFSEDKKTGSAEFRFYDIVENKNFSSLDELKIWLNVLLLKYIRITLDMYYLFLHTYTRKLYFEFEGEKELHYSWHRGKI